MEASSVECSLFILNVVGNSVQLCKNLPSGAALPCPGPIGLPCFGSEVDAIRREEFYLPGLFLYIHLRLNPCHVPTRGDDDFVIRLGRRAEGI